MIWFYAVDKEHYKNVDKDTLVVPTEHDVRRAISAGLNFKVVAPYLPPKELASLFYVIELPNKYGILTTQEVEYLNTLDEGERKKKELEIIENKVGLKIYKPDKISLVGLSGIKRFILSMKEIRDPKLRPKAIFLVGLPGTGKSFSAKYAAYFLDAYLVEFNISKILESPNPVFDLHSIFKYLEKSSQAGNRFVIWIDEIEKMFVGLKEEKRVFGQLLTILNDMNTPTGYQIDGVIWVTANNITDILNNNPEFLRRGRFDEIFFLDNPYEEYAKQILELYKEYYGLKYINIEYKRDTFAEDVIYLTNNLVYVQETSQRGSKTAERFIYVPSELQYIAKEAKIRALINKKYLETEDPELLKQLFPISSLKVVVKYLKSVYKVPIDESDRDSFYQRLGEFLISKLGSLGEVCTDINLVSILAGNEPLSIAMRDALSKMRSQEKLFCPAD